MFDPRLADVGIQHILPFGGTRDSVLTSINCMCWAGENGKTMISFMDEILNDFE